MANRIRSFIESIVYAGMKPGAQTTQDAAAPEMPGLRGRLERFLAGPEVNDPLYLTNRTFGERAQRVAMMAVPVFVVAGAIMLALYIWAPKAPKPVKQLTAAELAAKVLPNFNGNIKVETNHDIQVLEVHFEHNGPSQMLGNLQNNTDRVIPRAVVVFDLVDSDGSQLGGVTVTETNMAPGSVRKFQKGIDQKTAAFAMVREVRSQ